jgi:LuxR family maltose regulon positive regulatory protein
MSIPLLQTKLHIPPLRADRVSRTRLLARLDEGLRPEIRLILLSAPAGYGKTALLAEWVRAKRDAGVQAAWLSLEEGENDPARFWTYLIAALQAVEPGLGQGALAVLQSTGSPLASLRSEAILAVLINELAALEGLLLVLDDYHLIGEPAVHRGLAYLLDHLPPPVHLVIASRADPPLPLSRLRARNQLLELRVADLSFTPDEATAFLNDAMHLDLSPDKVAALDAQVEGWAVGLQMAALALQATARRAPAARNADAFLSGLARTQRYVLDYLVDEVFAAQPPAIQAFLLRTSVLERLCGPLCDALLEGPGEGAGTQILQYLERANLFLTPLDDRLEWVRYHPLFASLLRKRLEEMEPQWVSQLQRRASEWHEAHGSIAEAIDYALAAADHGRAVRLVESHAEATLMRSEHATVLRWIEALPDELVRARPHLCVFHAWALLLSGRAPELVEARLGEAAHGTTTDDVSGEIAVLRSLLALLGGQIAEAIDLAGLALERLPEERAFLRGVAADNLGIAYLSSGDLAAAEDALELAIALAQGTGNTMMAVAALCNLAGLRVLRGQLRLAGANYRRALEWSTDPRGQRLPVAAKALLGLGELAREWNDLDGAARYLTDALELCTQYGEIGALVCTLTLARVRSAQGDEAGGEEMMRKAGAIAVATRVTQIDDRLVAAGQARRSIEAGDLDRAAAWAQEQNLDVAGATATAAAAGLEGSPIDYNLRELEYLILARLPLAQGEPEQALALLQVLERASAQRGRTRRLIEILVLEALAMSQIPAEEGEHGRSQDALSPLGRALALAEPEGYLRTFLDGGPPMARLLYQVAERGIAVDYVGQLLAAFAAEGQQVAAAAKGPAPLPSPRADLVALAEPLSDRELEVLGLIAEGLSNRDIAERLYISLSTVKSHTASIYGKLGVHSRTEAVARAHAWGILPTRT